MRDGIRKDQSELQRITNFPYVLKGAIGTASRSTRVINRQLNWMPLARSISPSRITLKYEYVLPIVNQKSMRSAGIGTPHSRKNEE
jgi:hypothetical protein